MKKILIAVAVLILVPVLSLAAALFLTLRGLETVPADGKDLPGGARLVNDSFAAFYLLPRRYVRDVHDADWLLSYGGDVRAQGVPLAERIEVLPGLELARVAR